MKIDIGISDDKRKAIAAGLCGLLADTYTLYLKTQNFHWNVTGPWFHALHATFETQYTELALAIDVIAERIRALGSFAPGSYAEFTRLASIKEETGHPDAMAMLQQLVLGQEALIRRIRSLYDVASAADDEATLDLLTIRLQTHEKAAWMLRSMMA